MTAAEWTEILKTYAAYGANCMRFHSHIPPDAAFDAADSLGIMMEPELSHWNPETAFEDEKSQRYYRQELTQAIRHLANHPSFVMLTFGNELAAGDEGHRQMNEMLALARRTDSTRLYANASNAHYGALGCDPDSDFFTGMAVHEHMTRATSPNMEGYLNHDYPNAAHHYNGLMAAVRQTYQKPVFSFEVGQYEVLPDFDELADFQGVTRPDNLSLIARRVRERGLDNVWKTYVEATGELSNLCYREEIEACLRTEGMSGISLLGLQDFPGQGTALVGMLNSHLKPKPFAFAQPERFRRFFTARLPLALLEKYTYTLGETLTVPVRVANYGRGGLNGAVMYCLRGEGFAQAGELAAIHAVSGGLTDGGTLTLPLTGIDAPARLELEITFCGLQNTYPIWVYPAEQAVCPQNVYECRALDDAAAAVLAAGGRVYLSPASDEKSLPHSIQAQFSTDFWSVGTFPGQAGGMGQLIDVRHPVFKRFPTEYHTNWQWWPMASQRAVILPSPIQAIVTELDSYATLRPMAQLFECRVGGGRLMFSSMGLQNMQQYPEARALQQAIYQYMGSPDFQPAQELTAEALRGLVSAPD